MRWAATLLDAQSRDFAYVFVLWGSSAQRNETFDEVLGAVIALNDTQPVYDIVVLLTEAWAALEWPIAVLHSVGAKVGTVRNVDSVRCSGRFARGKEYLASSYTIYAIWTLEQYRAVLYMDTDSQVMRNVDHLFQAMLARPEVRQMGFSPRCYRVHAAEMQQCTCSYGMNTGVWMVRPSYEIFEQLMNMVRTGQPRFMCHIGFQVGVNAYFTYISATLERSKSSKCNPWMEPLARTYNCNDRLMASCIESTRDGTVHIVHWSGWPKPDHPTMWNAKRNKPRAYINYTEIPRRPEHDIHGPMHPLQAAAVSQYMRNRQHAARLREGYF
jgi:hypothetical protein